MLEPLTPEVRRELSFARVAALHRSAEQHRAGPVRRAVGSGLVRLGLRLGYDGSVPPFVSQPPHQEEAPAGVSSWSVTRAASLRTSVTRT